MSNQFLFEDRADAGQQLSRKLVKFADEYPFILALPRGGVAVGFEVAKFLRAEMNVLIARKIGLPYNHEFGIGAVAEGGIIVLDEQEIAASGLSREELEELIIAETAEVERRIGLYRGNRHNLQVEDRTVVIVDDGLATGVTARAAMESIKLNEPKKLVLATPVCSKESADMLQNFADEFICIHSPVNFWAVGSWYRQFPQMTDEQVVALLKRAHHEISPLPRQRKE